MWLSPRLYLHCHAVEPSVGLILSIFSFNYDVIGKVKMLYCLNSWNGRDNKDWQIEDGNGNKDEGMQLKTCPRTCQKEREGIMWENCCKARPQGKDSRETFPTWKFGRMTKTKRNYTLSLSGLIISSTD